MTTEFERERQRVEAEAQRERERIAKEALEAQERIRRQQSEAERQAEAIKAQAREAERIEQRKRDLPITRPSPLGTEQIIADVEQQRLKAHAEGEEVRAEIETGKAKAEAGIGKWQAESLAGIEQAEQEYEREVAKAEAKAEKEAEKARKAALARPSKEVFDELIAKGDIPKEAIFKSYDPTTGKVTYQIPDARTGKQIFDAMVKSKDIPKDATYISYDKTTGEIKYETPAKAPITITAVGVKEAEVVGIEKGLEVFRQLRASGDIPKEAIYQGYNRSTGEVKYTLPTKLEPEVVKLFGAELPEGGFKDVILKYRHALLVDESQLTGQLFGIKSPVLERMAAQTNRFFAVFAPRVEAKITEPQKFIPELGLTLAAWTPAVTDVLFWNERTPEERAISAVISALIIFPFARAGVRNIRAKISPFKVASEQLIKTEMALTKQTAEIMSKTYGKEVTSNFKALGKAQTKYIEQLVKLDTLELAKKPNIAKIKTANLQAESLARELEAIGNKYVKSIKGKAGFDTPTIARMIDDLAKEMVRNTRSAVIGLKSTETQIKMLKANLARAETTLKAAQIKYPTEPSKWVDLMADHALAQSKLEAALSGSTTNLYADLLKARQALTKAKTTAARLKAQAEVYRLEGKMRTALKSMEVEWGRGGMLTRGRVALAVKPPPTRITGAPSRVRPEVKPAEMPSAVALLTTLRADYALSGAEVQKIEPMIIESIKEATKISTNPDVIKATEQVTAKAIQEAIDLKIAGYTQAEIMNQIEPRIQAMIEPITKPELKAQLQAKVKILTKLAVRTASRATTKIIIRIRPLITSPSGKKRPMTEKELEGAIAWKQGFIYIMIYPPYGKHNIEYSRKPFAGVRTTTGARSAYETLVRIGGKLPATIRRDMGIMDIEIHAPKIGKPVLVFKADIRQRTRLTPRTRRAKLSRLKARRPTKPSAVGIFTTRW